MKVNIREKLQVQWQASTLPNSKNLWPRMCQIPSKNRRSARIMNEKISCYHHLTGWPSGLGLPHLLLARQVVQEINSWSPQMFFSQFKIILSLCVVVVGTMYVICIYIKITSILGGSSSAAIHLRLETGPS